MMGFSDYDWYYKAAYVSPMMTNLGSSKSQHIEAFINNAYRYLGTEYVVGAAGKPKTGVDCSGLVMQSMYATGVDPYPISVIRHSQPGYEYESRNFWASTQLKTIPVKDRARGDLIFYQNKSGTVIHVAIYLGNNKVIESVPTGVRIADWITVYPSVKGVKRVFN
jgi:cell wall-associated NlpC family hydrolase